MIRFIDKLTSDQELRHAWLVPAAEQVRKWRAEDERNGQPWGHDNQEQSQ